ncbi:unnamed protein product [Heterobilharzia americana]|nr:unnamed protein product [Heterobilharzia americana]
MTLVRQCSRAYDTVKNPAEALQVAKEKELLLQSCRRKGDIATSSTPSAPLYPTSSSPPPPYQGPPAYVPPPPTYEETRLPPVIVTQPPTTVFKWNPVGIVCPYCHSSVVTKVRSEAGLLAWLLCGVLCLMGLWAFCCLIPFYLESTQDVIHTCPLCKSQVGYYKPL